MNYSYIPQKIVQKLPIYSENPQCPKCESNKSYPFMNMHGSTRVCYICNNHFSNTIIGYKDQLVEKDVDKKRYVVFADNKVGVIYD
jgi:hypothetical protein